MAAEQVVFARIDTTDGTPYFEGASCCELMIAALFGGQEKNWYDLLSFVILPCEIQLLFVPRRLAASLLVTSLEPEIHATVGVLKPIGSNVLDTDFYREKVDFNEEVRQRLRWMHLAPVRAHLTTLAESYPYSSAHPRFRDLVYPLQKVTLSI